ncbi:MAG: MFS transporter, partial [Acidimicrobiia bacterium]
MRRVLFATAAATTACVFPPFLLGGMAVQIRADLGFSEAGIGLGVGAFFATASVLSALSGRGAERVGGDRGLRLAALWSAVVQMGIAGLADSLPVLLVLLALAGTANALAQPAANLVISRALPLGRQGLGFAVKQSAIPASTLLAGLAVPTLALTVGWRWAFVGSALLSLVSAVCVPVVAGAAGRRRAATGSDGAGRAPMGTMAVLSLGIALGAAAAGTLGAFLV